MEGSLDIEGKVLHSQEGKSRNPRALECPPPPLPPLGAAVSKGASAFICEMWTQLVPYRRLGERVADRKGCRGLRKAVQT